MRKELKQALWNAAVIFALFASLGYISETNNAMVRPVVDGYEDHKGYAKAITTSSSLETILGEALPSNVVGVTIVNTDSSTTLYMQADGNAATATTFPIPAGMSYIASGDKAQLDNLRLYAASSVNVGVMVHVLD